MSTITKAVIPAAGRGTRLRPLTEYLPKPMLPLGRKPVLQHIVEEVGAAGIEEIALIVRSDQKAVFSRYSGFSGLELLVDDSFSGPGGALLKAEEFVAGSNFVTVLADAPVRGPGRERHLNELINLRKTDEAAAALSLYRIPGSEAGDRGVVAVEEREGPEKSPLQITGMTEKPPAGNNGKRWASACRYVFGPEIFEMLKKADRAEKGELQLTAGIRQLIKEKRPVLGLPLPDGLKRYDTGNFEGYFEAFSAFTE